jgi:hypothetical protein
MVATSPMPRQLALVAGAQKSGMVNWPNLRR